MPLPGSGLQGKTSNFSRLLPIITAMRWPSRILIMIVMMTWMSDKVDARTDDGIVAVQHEQPTRADVGCGFHLLTGGPSPIPVGQISSGQCRAGSRMTPSLFTWFGDAFVDQQGRGCWWTRKSGFPCPNTAPLSNEMPSRITTSYLLTKYMNFNSGGFR